MHQPKRLRLTASIVLCFVLQALGADKYTDENRPYEFGFKIDGEQHRHESKDKDGIIMGEFGFITADDVYHVTVYATDKEGRFKILSMKNIHLKSSSASSLGPTSARQGHALALPPAQPASVQASAVPQQPLKQGGAPTPPQQGRFAPQSPVPQGAFAPQAPVPQGAFAPQPEKPNKPVPIEPPGKSCSSCSLPTTTTRAPPPAYNQVADNNNYNSPNQFDAPGASPQNQQAFSPTSPGQQNIAQGGPIVSSYSPQGGQQNYPSSQQNIPQQGLIAPGGATSFAPQPGQTPRNYLNSTNDSQKSYSPNTYAQPGGGILPSTGQTQGGTITETGLGQTNSGEQNRLFSGNNNPYAEPGPSGSATTVPNAGNYANGNGQQAGSLGQSFYPQGSPGQNSYPQGSPGQNSYAQGSPGQSSYPQVSPGQSSYPQVSPGQNSYAQGSPGQSSYPQVSPGQSSYPQGSPGQSYAQGSPGQSSYPQVSLGKSSYPQVSPGQSSYPQGSPGQRYAQGSPGQSSYPQVSPGQSSYPQGSPVQSYAQGSPGQSSYPQVSLGQSSYPQVSPGQSSYPQVSPGQSSYPQVSPGQSSYPQGSPGQSYAQGSPGQNSYPQGTPAQSSYPQGSPGQSSYPQISPGQGSYPQGGAGERTAKQYNGPRQPLDSQLGPNGSQGPGATQGQRGSTKPTLFSAQMQIVDKNTDIYALGPNEQKGLPPGIAQGDMTTLLYTFNYTVGFHGHFEEGYTNGVKKGYYFVTGRNGVRTRIDYVADDTGFNPTVSQEVLDLLSEDVPKPETEKDDKYGLKGYEFKWLYYPVESK